MDRFDRHRFDPETGELVGPDGSRRLAPQPARLLAMLLEHRGELVGREAIRAALWPETTVDFDAGLHTCVRQVRAGLRETGGQAEWVETLAKRGYRFVGPLGGSEREAQAAAAAAATGGHTSTGRSLGGWRGVAALGALAAVVLVVGWLRTPVVPGSAATTSPPSDAPPSSGGLAAATERPRLAVVPFVDPLSDAHAAFNRDLTEAFVTALVAVSEDLVVVGPTTTAPHFSDGSALADVATAVDADFVLHGGHRSSADIVFVEVVLPDGEHLYAQRMPLDPRAAAEAPADVVAAMAASILDAFGRASDAPVPDR